MADAPKRYRPGIRLLLALTVAAVILSSLTRAFPQPAAAGGRALWHIADDLGEVCEYGAVFLALGLL